MEFVLRLKLLLFLNVHREEDQQADPKGKENLDAPLPLPAAIRSEDRTWHRKELSRSFEVLQGQAQLTSEFLACSFFVLNLIFHLSKAFPFCG